MKIAYNTRRTSVFAAPTFGALFVMMALVTTSAHADPAAAPPLAMSGSMSAPAGEMAPPANPSEISSASNAKNNTKALSPLEDKVTDAIKGSVKQLGSVDSINLDDLNAARQSIVKLEVLIDIEKHLSELEKIKAERTGSEKSLAPSIPASALNMPPSMPFGGQTMQQPMEPMPVVKTHAEVAQIIGADGHYAAVIQDKTYHIGDSLSDGSTVVAISSRAIETKLKDGSMHQIRVKGVDEVYGHTL